MVCDRFYTGVTDVMGVTVGRAMRRGMRASGGVCTLMASALLLWACGRQTDARIGVVLGDEGVRAARLALDDLNATGGRRIGLRALSGAFGSSAQVALQGAESLAVDPTVLAVVGHTNSSASLAASQVYNAQHVVQIAPTSTSPLYSQAGPYSFRLVASDAHQAHFIAQQIGVASARRVAIVYANDDYGRALRRLVIEDLATRGVHPVYQGPYAESETDGGDLVRALGATQPTLLVWLGRDPFYSRIAPALHAAMPALPVLASDGFGGSSVNVALRESRHEFEGVRYVRLVDVDARSAAMRKLRERYRDQPGGGEMTDQAVLAYDAVMLLGTAVREAGPDREAIRAWLNQLGRSRPQYVGVTGPIGFSPDGDRPPTYLLVAADTGARRQDGP